MKRVQMYQPKFNLSNTKRERKKMFHISFTTAFLCFCHSPPLCASLLTVGNACVWRCVSCCRAILLGNKALVWMGWQVVKISSAWEMPVFPSTFCLLLSIIWEQQTADVSPLNKGSVRVCACVCACVRVWNRCSSLLEADKDGLRKLELIVN